MDYVCFMFGHLGSTNELKHLIIFICFKWLNNILVARWPKTGFFAKTMIHVSDTSVFINICLNDFFKVCVTLGLHLLQFHY